MDLFRCPIFDYGFSFSVPDSFSDHYTIYTISTPICHWDTWIYMDLYKTFPVAEIIPNHKKSRKQPVCEALSITIFNSPSRARTYDNTVNSRALYRLSYRGSFSPLHLQNYTSTFSIPWTQGQAFDLLVSVSFTCYHASTPDLSTSSSSRGLIGF